MKKILWQSKSKFLPPEIPEVCLDRISGFEICENEGQITAFSKKLEYGDYIETEFTYSKENSFKGNLFLLIKIREEMNKGKAVVGTSWKHNKKMMSIYRKLGYERETGYVWTEINQSIIWDKNLKPFWVDLTGEEDYLIYNGMYLSLSLSELPYSKAIINEIMEKFQVPVLVVYSKFPNFRKKMYEYVFFEFNKKRVEKFIRLYKKKLKGQSPC